MFALPTAKMASHRYGCGSGHGSGFGFGTAKHGSTRYTHTYMYVYPHLKIPGIESRAGDKYALDVG